MKHKKISLFFLLSLFIFSIKAQDKESSGYFMIGLEAGINSISGELNEKWPVRQDVGKYNPHYGSNNISTLTNGFFFGIKPEYVFCNEKFGVTSGIRYTRLNSTLSKESSQKDYFYMRYGGDETSTNFARIREIKEVQDYIGIPLEFRWTPIRFSIVGFYIKIGTDINFKVNSNMNIDFVEESMAEKKQEILDYVDIEDNNIYSTLYGILGLRLDIRPNIRLNIEALLPSLYLTKNNFAFFEPDNQSGARISLQIPINKK